MYRETIISTSFVVVIVIIINNQDLFQCLKKLHHGLCYFF
jgi:hypothetical protein